MTNRYDYFKNKFFGSYNDLVKKALKPNATFEDKANLLCWLEQYGENWNGESYTIDKNHSLYPIYQGVGAPDEDDDFDEFMLVDIEIR